MSPATTEATVVMIPGSMKLWFSTYRPIRVTGPVELDGRQQRGIARDEK